MSDTDDKQLPAVAEPMAHGSHALMVAGEDAVKMVKETLMPGATDAELAFFIEVCNRMQLDPFRKEIHPVKRRQKSGNQWVERWVFQTGIDGYRKRAAATGKYAGSEVDYDTPFDALNPNVATATVYRMVDGVRVPFVAHARWREFVQTDSQGNPTMTWRQMPFVMLAKCAEAQALRKAFPDALNGIYTDEEMMQSDNQAALRLGQQDAESLTIRSARKAQAEPKTEPKATAAAPAPEVPAPADDVLEQVEQRLAEHQIQPSEFVEALVFLGVGGVERGMDYGAIKPKTLRGLLKAERWQKVCEAVEELRQDTEPEDESELVSVNEYL